MYGISGFSGGFGGFGTRESNYKGKVAKFYSNLPLAPTAIHRSDPTFLLTLAALAFPAFCGVNAGFP
jgi:hypothetical protein